MSGVSSMGEIFHIAHKVVDDIFDGDVEIQEKVDGSQFSFQVTDNELFMRSKGQQLFQGNPSSSMFSQGMLHVMNVAALITPGWIYRAEYLQKAKHNTLAYDRHPQGHLVIFDIETSMGVHATAEVRAQEAEKLGMDAVPVLFRGRWEKGLPGLYDLLETVSYLGGQKIEGVVVKNFDRFIHGQMMQAKYVSPEFKETHKNEWKTSNPNKGDVVAQLISNLKSEARWNKGVQHLRDDGLLVGALQDIGPLLKEISKDVHKEEEDYIKEMLFKWAWPQISRGITAGFVDWYKQKLIDGEVDV